MAAKSGDLAQSGIEVLPDDFPLRERGIPTDLLQPGVRASALDVVIDRLAEGAAAVPTSPRGARKELRYINVVTL